MSFQKVFVVGLLTTLRPRMVEAYRMVEQMLSHGLTVEIVVRERKTEITSEQMKKLNAMCGDLAEQVLWDGESLTKDEWRHWFVAAYRQDQRIVRGLNGGIVVLGSSSKKLKVSECSDVIEMLNAFGAERGVTWSDPTIIPDEYYEHQPEAVPVDGPRPALRSVP